MKRELLRKYLWLIDVVRHHKKISFEEIASKWEESSVNIDHSPLALRTFHNHRDAIETLFGIRIVCNRADHNKYYIPDDDSAGSTRLKIWMLQTLAMSQCVAPCKNLTDRVLIDMPNDGQLTLASIIEAMRDEVSVNLTYSSEEGIVNIEVGPYCVRYWQNKWYFLGEILDTHTLKVFDVTRILSMTATESYFEFPDGFDAKEYFKDYFGFPDGSDGKATVITLALSGQARSAVLHNPLHKTQCEINNLGDFSLFTLKIVPTEEFFDTILGMGEEAEIITPPAVRRTMREKIMRISDNYDNRPDPAMVYRAKVAGKSKA